MEHKFKSGTRLRLVCLCLAMLFISVNFVSLSCCKHPTETTTEPSTTEPSTTEPSTTEPKSSEPATSETAVSTTETTTEEDSRNYYEPVPIGPRETTKKQQTVSTEPTVSHTEATASHAEPTTEPTIEPTTGPVPSEQPSQTTEPTEQGPPRSTAYESPTETLTTEEEPRPGSALPTNLREGSVSFNSGLQELINKAEGPDEELTVTVEFRAEGSVSEALSFLSSYSLTPGTNTVRVALLREIKNSVNIPNGVFIYIFDASV